MSAVHPTILLRRLTKVMTLAKIAHAVDCHRSTLDRAMKGQRHSDFPAEIAERLQALLRDQTRTNH